MRLLYRFNFISIFIFVGNNYGKSQTNLVPNPSFENIINCDSLNLSITDWDLGDPSFDIHNSCLISNFGVPNGNFGYQTAFDGEGYAGLSVMSSYYFERETIGTELLQPLIIGNSYHISFRINKANSFFNGIDKIGALLSTIPFWGESSAASSQAPPVNNFAHIYSNSIISDTVSWIQVQGDLIADSSYSYIYIGNFFDDTSVNLLNQSSFDYLYYYIDAVEIILTKTNGFLNYQKENLEINISSNFTDGIIYYNIPNKCNVSIEIVDLSGKIYSPNNYTNNFINISNLNNGIYFLHFTNEYDSVVKKVIKY